MAGGIGAPPDPFAVVAHPSSVSGDVPAGNSLAKGLEKKKNSQPTTSSGERICRSSHEGTGANVCRPHDKSRAHPGAECAPPVQSAGDQVVQGSVVADEVGDPPDSMGMVAHPSSGSRDVPAGKSESTPPSNPGDGSYHGGDVLVDLDEEAPPSHD